MDVENIHGVMEIATKVGFGWGKERDKGYCITAKEPDMRDFGKMIVNKDKVLYSKGKELGRFKTEQLRIY